MVKNETFFQSRKNFSKKKNFQKIFVDRRQKRFQIYQKKIFRRKIFFRKFLKSAKKIFSRYYMKGSRGVSKGRKFFRKKDRTRNFYAGAPNHTNLEEFGRNFFFRKKNKNHAKTTFYFASPGPQNLR